MCMPKRPGGPYSIFLQENWHNESTKPTNIRVGLYNPLYGIYLPKVFRAQLFKASLA